MIPEEIENGMKLLDEKVPGWRKRINLDELNMQSYIYANGCGCILAQLFDDYGVGIDELGLIDPQTKQYGFDVYDAVDYPVLTGAWKQALSEERT